MLSQGWTSDKRTSDITIKINYLVALVIFLLTVYIYVYQFSSIGPWINTSDKSISEFRSPLFLNTPFKNYQELFRTKLKGVIFSFPFRTTHHHTPTPHSTLHTIRVTLISLSPHPLQVSSPPHPPSILSFAQTSFLPYHSPIRALLSFPNLSPNQSLLSF